MPTCTEIRSGTFCSSRLARGARKIARQLGTEIKAGRRSTEPSKGKRIKKK